MTPEISALLGIVGGGLIGFLASLYVTRHQRYTATISSVAPMKYQWVCELRDCVGKVLASFQDPTEITPAQRTHELIRLELLLNQKHEALVSRLALLRRKHQDSENAFQDLEIIELFNICMTECKEMAQKEWDRIQDPERI